LFKQKILQELGENIVILVEYEKGSGITKKLILENIEKTFKGTPYKETPYKGALILWKNVEKRRKNGRYK